MIIDHGKRIAAELTDGGVGPPVMRIYQLDSRQEARIDLSHGEDALANIRSAVLNGSPWAAGSLIIEDRSAVLNLFFAGAYFLGRRH